jgi:hypothetical protein
LPEKGDTSLAVDGEPSISVLVLAFLASLALTFLMAAATHARTGLRGRRVYLWTGFALGLVAGFVEIAVAIQLLPVTALLSQLGRSLWFELAVESAIAAFSYLVLVGLLLQIGRFIHRRKARRRGDIVALAAGLGCGLALTATLLRLADPSIWPPSSLFVAVVYPPVQLGFVLLLAAASLAAREGLAGRTMLWQLMAVLVQFGYQFILRANETIGHWLAWLEPGQIGALWLGLIILAWTLGLGIMSGLGQAEPEPAYRAADRKTGLLRARLWVWLAGLVLVASALLVGLSLFVELDAAIVWIMILALLATPVMAAAILLRTAFSLKRDPDPEPFG